MEDLDKSKTSREKPELTVLRFEDALLPPTPEQLLAKFGHAKSLGMPEESRLAKDQALSDSGMIDMVSHAYELGIDFYKSSFLGYGALAQLTQNGLVRACIVSPVADMTRNWIEIVRTGDDTEGTSITAEITESFDKFKIKKLLTSAAELTGFFGGCFIFIDTGVDGEKLQTPLMLSHRSGELRKGSLRGFTLIEPVNVAPGDYNATNPIAQDFYKPRNWYVMGRKIHHSRLIKISGPLPSQLLLPMYNFLGIPQSQLICDYVLHFQKDRLEASSLLQNMASKVLKSNMSKTLNGEYDENLMNRVKLLVQNQDNHGVLVLDKDQEDFIKVEHSLAGVADIVQQALELICAVNGTPVVKTLGLSPKGFNATGEIDLKNYYDRIKGLQSEQLQPALEKILKIVQLHLYGVVDDTITFNFKPLSEDDRQLKANIQKTIAETAAIYLTNGVVSPEEVRDNLAADPESGFDDIDVDNVPELDFPETDPLPQPLEQLREPVAPPEFERQNLALV